MKVKNGTVWRPRTYQCAPSGKLVVFSARTLYRSTNCSAGVSEKSGGAPWRDMYSSNMATEYAHRGTINASVNDKSGTRTTLL